MNDILRGSVFSFTKELHADVPTIQQLLLTLLDQALKTRSQFKKSPNCSFIYFFHVSPKP